MLFFLLRRTLISFRNGTKKNAVQRQLHGINSNKLELLIFIPQICQESQIDLNVILFLYVYNLRPRIKKKSKQSRIVYLFFII